MESRKEKATRKRSARGNASEDLSDRLLGAALEMSAKEGWSAVTLARLAESLGVSYGHVIAICPTRTAIAKQLIRGIDHRILKQVSGVDLSESARDRLFELLMIGFDVLQEHRDSYVGLIRYTQRRPAVLLILGPKIVHSIALVMIMAGINTDGLMGVIRTKALTAALAVVVRTWLEDTSADMAATMSALDKALRRLESAEKILQSWARRGVDKPKKD